MFSYLRRRFFSPYKKSNRTLVKLGTSDNPIRSDIASFVPYVDSVTNDLECKAKVKERIENNIKDTKRNKYLIDQNKLFKSTLYINIINDNVKRDVGNCSYYYKDLSIEHKKYIKDLKCRLVDFLQISDLNSFKTKVSSCFDNFISIDDNKNRVSLESFITNIRKVLTYKVVCEYHSYTLLVRETLLGICHIDTFMNSSVTDTPVCRYNQLCNDDQKSINDLIQKCRKREYILLSPDNFSKRYKLITCVEQALTMFTKDHLSLESCIKNIKYIQSKNKSMLSTSLFSFFSRNKEACLVNDILSTLSIVSEHSQNNTKSNISYNFTPF